MKHETASLLESRAEQASQQWFLRYDKDQKEDLLDSMRYFIEAAEVHSSIDAAIKHTLLALVHPLSAFKYGCQISSGSIYLKLMPDEPLLSNPVFKRH